MVDGADEIWKLKYACLLKAWIITMINANDPTNWCSHADT